MAEPNIPYCRHVLGEADIDAVTEVLRSGWIARGPKSREFEEAFAQQVQADHAVSCANGSVALEIALRGLGIGPGDDVVVPTLTWVASAMAILKVGARPVFADVDPITHNLTTDSVAAAWTPSAERSWLSIWGAFLMMPKGFVNGWIPTTLSSSKMPPTLSVVA